VLRILAVCLLLAHSLGSNRCRVSGPQLEPQLRQQVLEPARVPCRFYSHSHADSSLFQLAIKSFGFSIAMQESPLATFSILGVYPCDLLHARVIVAALYPACNCPISAIPC
jgi:hypothetical protein